MTSRSFAIYIFGLEECAEELVGERAMARSKYENSGSFAKMTVGVGALSAVFTETTVAEKSQLCLTDLLPGENPRQDQIQNRNAVIKTAGGHSQKRCFP
jgi:hypothetical protein